MITANINVHDYIEIFLRRIWCIIIPLVLAVGAAATYAKFCPRTYLASTTILVTPQEVPVDYVRPTVTSTIEDRLYSIQQEIMSRTRLETIISEFNLYAEEGKKLASEEIIERMRKNIIVKIAEKKGKKQGYFTLSYEGTDPVIVTKVTSRLASLFVEENLKLREQQAQGTTEFLAQELNATKEKLEKQEKILTDYKQKYMAVQAQMETLKGQLSVLQAKYTESHPEVLNTKKAIKNLEKVIAVADKKSTIMANLSRDYESTKETNRKLLEKSEQAQQAENLERRQKGEQFRVIDPARIPEKPFRPNIPKIFLFGLLLGMGSGFGLAFLREQMDRSFRDAEDLKATLGFRVLTNIPKIEKKGNNGLQWHWSQQFERGVEHLQPAAEELLSEEKLIYFSQPRSLAAEQFRKLRTYLLKRKSSEFPGTIMVTSANSGEGKSFVSANLAIGIAHDFHSHALLVDCDLRNPSLAQWFGLDDGNGLSDYLRGDGNISECIKKTKVERLTLLPGGKVGDNPTELIGSRKMEALVHELRSRYHDRYVIFDSTPLLATSESEVLAKLVDSIVIVVRAGSTARETVKQAIASLEKDKILGFVLNDVQFRSSGLSSRYFGSDGYYYKYGYGYGYRRKGSNDPGRQKRILPFKKKDS